MAEFTIGEFDYTSAPMGAITQIHVVRRLSPAMGVISKVLPAVALFRDLAGQEGGIDIDLISRIMFAKEGTPDAAGAKPFQEAATAAIDALGTILGRLDDEDTTYIINECLALCSRRPKGQTGPVSQVWNNQGKTPQHADIKNNAGVMLRITFNVLRANLKDFFTVNLPSSGIA